MKVLKDLAVSGQITVGQLLQSSIDTDKFLVSDGGVVKFRTGSQLLGDIDGVINTRTITINGTAQDLTANRSWTVGDVRTDSSYANPAWITSLAWSKIAGAPAFLTSYSETDPIYASERDALLLNKMVHSTQLWSTLADFNRPSGYSTMIQPSSYQNPVGTHGYFHVIARRDTGGGYGVLLQAYNSGEIYHGNTTDSTQNISWYRIWNSSNFNPSNYLPLAGGTLTGKVTFQSAVENRPQMPGGILGLDTGDGNFDIWGISRDYYPSHATAANAWGILWNGDNNQIRFIGAGSQRLVIDLDGGSTGALTWEGNNIWHAGNLTNLNQLTNGPGYITSYTETDTLATVTGRGASTSTALSLNGGVTITGPNAWNAATPMLNIGGTGDGRMQVRHIWGKEAGTANPDHLWLQYTNSTFGVQIGASGGSNPLYVAGDIYMGGYFGGNLVATRTWVQSQGYITSGSFLPLSGGTMTGDLRFNQGSGFGRIAFTDNYHGMILRGIPNNAAGDVTAGDYTSLIQHSGDFRFYRTNGSINELYFQVNASAAYWRGNTIIHSGTIGSQSVAFATNADTVDGYHMNQNVLTSSSPTFQNITADGSVGAYGLRFRNGAAITYCGFGGGELNNIFHTESAWGNLRHNDISNYEVSADGSSWSAGTLDANIYNLFLGERDKGGSLTIAASGVGRYQRFTFAIGYKNFDMLHITGSTNGEQIYIKLETSTDGGSTYTENFTSIWSSWPGNHTKVWSIFNSAITRIRLTIYKPGNNYGNYASINSINYYGGYSGYGERYHMQVYSYDYQTANITRNTTIGGSLIVYSNQTISGSGYGLYFSGGNNRIYFGGSRAIEGNGTNLQIGEGHSQTQIQSATTQVDGNIVMAKGADPRIYSNTNVGLNIDGQALYLNRYVSSDISMVFGGGNVMIGPYSGPSFALHVKKNQNQVAGFESPNANTWIDLISTAGTWSMGATSSNTWAIYQRGGTNATRFEVGASSASLYGNTVWHAGNLTNLNQLSNGPGYITQTNALQPIYGDSGAHNLNVSGQQANIRYSTGQWVNGPTSGNYSHVLSFNLASDNRTVQMYLGDVPGYLWWRPNQGGTWHPWERILTSNNIGSFALTSLPAHNHDGSAITTGTVANARTTASSSNGTDTIVLRNASGYFDTEGVGVNKYIYLGGYRTFGLGNLGADGPQAKRYEIARLGIDYNDWNTVGTFEVELHESYYGQGLKKVYNIWYGYVSNSGLRLVEYRGNGANNFRVVIGSEVTVSGDHRYLPVYVDVSYYGSCHVVIRTNRFITGNSNSAVGSTYIFNSPTGVNTSNFTADSTPEITTASSATIGGNTIWHAGNLTNLNQLSNGPGYFNTSNDGSGSGLDADLLDGRDGGGYLTHTYSGFSFPTGSHTGWYRIARSSQSSGGQGVRGGFKIIVSSTGNYLTPAQDEITGFKDWTTTLHIQSVMSSGSTPFTNYRLTYDADYTYLEGYINSYFGGDQSIAVQSFHWGLNGLTWSPHTGNAVASTTSSGATSIGKNSNGSTFAYIASANGASLNGVTGLNGKITFTDATYMTGSPTHGFRFNSANDAFNNVIMRDNGNVEVRGSMIVGAVSSTPQATLQVVGGMRWSSGGNSYYTYSDMDGGGLYIETVDNNTSRAKMRFQTRVNNSGNYIQYQLDANNSRFYWEGGGSAKATLSSSTGTFTVSGDVVAYGSPSDNRLKTIKSKVNNAVEKVSKLNGYYFDWNEVSDLAKIKEDIGVIAQEVAEVLPELARTNDDGYMSVRYQGLTAVLIEAVKEQQKQIEELKTKLNAVTK